MYVGANPEQETSATEEQQKKLRVQDNPAVTENYVNKVFWARTFMMVERYSPSTFADRCLWSR